MFYGVVVQEQKEQMFYSVDKSRARAVSEILTTGTQAQTDRPIGRGEAGTRARGAAQPRREAEAEREVQ